MRKNPNSPIRSGYNYEDVFTLKLCTDWLLDSKKYKEIRIQYKPENVGTSHFSIDDIVATRSDNTIEFYQLKHKQNPDSDLWTFEDLINKGIKKWIKSYLDLKQYKTQCYLITNGQASNDLLEYIEDGYFNFKKLITSELSFYNELLNDFEKEELNNFFNNFNFKFNQPGKKELEEEVRYILYKELKVLKSAVDHLLLTIASEGAERYPSSFTLEKIRSFLSFDDPRPLNQNFEVPIDFEFFNKDTHELLMNDLVTTEGGVKVIYGKPGSGKSTYLSKLYSLLKSRDILVFRHHYHINLKDATRVERLNKDRAVEGLKAQFKSLDQKVIESLGEVNTESFKLKEFIDKIAGFCRKNNKSFVLIIDGLDHVIREGNSERELVEFLTEVIFPQQGYWLILGTQELATHSFPNTLMNLAPKKEWIEIKGLNRQAIKNITINKFKIEHDKNDFNLESIITKLCSITSGNPLHLRYVINEVRNYGSNISEYDLDKIPHYNNEIGDYYSNLWRQLPSLCKTISYAIVVLDFKLQEDQLNSLISKFSTYPSEATDSFNTIRHLFRFDLSGISIFHNSFNVFIVNQEELYQQKILLFQKLKIWLNEKEQDSLRWLELPKVEYYLGESDRLLNIDNEWIIDHYLKDHNELGILGLLNLASKAAFERNRFDKTIYFSIASNLYENREANLDSAIEKIWTTAFKYKDHTNLRSIDFKTLSHYQIKYILIELKKLGFISDIPGEIYDRIDELFKEAWGYQAIKIAESCVSTLVYFDKTNIKKSFTFIKQFRDDRDYLMLFEYYVQELLASLKNPIAIIKKVLLLDLTIEEKNALVKVLVTDDLNQNTSRWEQVLMDTNVDNFYFYFYRIVLGNEVGIIQLKTTPIYLDKSISFPVEDNDKVRLPFLSIFFNSFISAYTNRVTFSIDFTNDHNDIWLSDMVTAINQVNKELVLKIKNKELIDIKVIIAPIIKLPKLKFNKNRDIYDYQQKGLPYLIDCILWISKVFNQKNKLVYHLQLADLDFLGKCTKYNTEALFELINSRNIEVEKNDLEIYILQKLEQIQNKVMPFKENAELIAELAVVSSNFLSVNITKKLLVLTASNILSYGGHKYMLLYDILKSIEICINEKSAFGKEYLNIIFPYVFHIEKLTTGDETRHFMNKLCSLLPKVDNFLLFNIYMYNIDIREYSNVDELFDYVLDSLDYSDPIARAIGKTAINKHYQTLLDIQKKGNRVVDDIVEEVSDEFGLVEIKEESEPYTKEEDKTDYIAISTSGIKSHIFSNKELEKKYLTYYDCSFLASWLKRHLEQGTDEEELLAVLKDIIGDNFLDISSELLDIIYPLAIDFDEEFAFKCICWAQSNGGGWVSYYSENLEYAQKRWKNVLLYFPAREDQFYIDSVTNAGRNYGREKQYNVPIPNSTQFYFDCNQGEKAEDITKNYIEVLTKIFPNVNLSLPEYLQNLEEVSLFDILLSRLTWISPIVRYKAVESISELLENDKNGDYHKLFFEYLSYVGLENRCCEGLLVILKSLKNKDSFTFKYLSKVSLIDLISIKSLSIDMFVAQIYSILSVEYKPYELFINHVVNTNQSSDVEEDNFIKLIQSNLPSYYLNYIKEIQHHIGNSYDFLSMWSHQYQEYCNNFDLKKESDEESRYCHTNYQYMIGKCTIYGDILKSTFIRVVEYLYNIRCLNSYYLKEYLLKSLPIDILMSDIKKGTKPNWWPEIIIPKEFVKSKDYTKEVLDFIRSHNQEAPLYFHGSYSTKYEFYNSNTYCEIEAITFMTKELKSYIKSLGLPFVYKQIANFGAWYVDSNNVAAYPSFENNLMFKGFCSSDLFNCLVSPMKSSLNNVWQYYRVFNPMYLLSPLLSSTLDLVIDKGTLKYEENGKVIAHCNDFLVKFKDTSYCEEPMPYNNYLMINRDFINQISSEYEMKLMVIVKQTIFVKDRRNDVFDATESFKIIEL